MHAEHASQLRSAMVWTVLVAAAHFALSTTSHSVHVLHIALSGLFVIPVLTVAVAFELRGGLLAAAVVSAVYLAHMLWSWRDSPMANLDQYAWIGVYFVVGGTAGHLVKLANFRKQQRDEVIRKSRQLEMVQGLTGLLTAMGVRDAATLAHCRRVASIAEKIGRELGFAPESLTCLRLAALMHDIGKVGVPDNILHQDGALSEEQIVVIRHHVELAAGMLRPITGTDEIARIVSMHHECPDGSGYPRGLKGEAIIREARVLRVADVFAALTESRPYHTALSTPEAIKRMKLWAGTKLDPTAMEALGRLVESSHGRGAIDEDQPTSNHTGHGRS